MPDYRNSTVHALEIGLAFRRHPADKDYFLQGDKNILSSSLQLLADLPNYYNPHPSNRNPPKKTQQPIFIPNSSSVCRQLTFLDTVAMGLTTDI